MSDLGPPDSMTAEELCEHFATRPAPQKVMDLPEVMHLSEEPYKKIRIVIPPDSADSSARLDAVIHVRDLLKKKGGREPTADDMNIDIVRGLVGDRCAKEMLARVLYAPQSGGETQDGKPILKRIFTGANHIEQSLHSDEINILFGLFCSVRRELGPRPFVLSQDPELLRQWIDRLKEGAWSLGPLEWLASADLQELCCSALRLLSSLEEFGVLLLTSEFLESLRTLASTQTKSDSGNTSSGELAENSAPSTGEPEAEYHTLTAEEAMERAAKLLRR